MNILRRVMAELRETSSPAELGELAHRLGVQPSALQGMLDVLEAKGVLTRPVAADATQRYACAPGCGTACDGLAMCPYVIAVGSLQPITLKAQTGRELDGGRPR